MHKKFEINGTKIKVDCQSGRKVVTHNSKNDLPLVSRKTSLIGGPLAITLNTRIGVVHTSTHHSMSAVIQDSLGSSGIWPFSLLSDQSKKQQHSLEFSRLLTSST